MTVRFLGTIDATQVDVWESFLCEGEWSHWQLEEDVLEKTARVQGFFAEETEAEKNWEMLLAALPESLTVHKVERFTVEECDWKYSYREHFHPWRYGTIHWVPEWLRQNYPHPEDHSVLWLDPGLAFGTGNHPTTRLCLRALVDSTVHSRKAGLPIESRRVTDAGCGSGILALSAVLLGYQLVRGFDIDGDAIAVARENAMINALDGRVDWSVGGLSSQLPKAGSDILLANIQSDVLLAEAKTLCAAVAPGGQLILSGILREESEKVLEGFSKTCTDFQWQADFEEEWCGLTGWRRPGSRASRLD